MNKKIKFNLLFTEYEIDTCNYNIPDDDLIRATEILNDIFVGNNTDYPLDWLLNKILYKNSKDIDIVTDLIKAQNEISIVNVDIEKIIGTKPVTVIRDGIKFDIKFYVYYMIGNEMHTIELTVREIHSDTPSVYFYHGDIIFKFHRNGK